MSNPCFKRAGVRYSETPQPSTPYQAAGQLWDERIGSARVQARNWQLMALCSTLLSVTLVGGLLWQSTRLKITPYIVEIDAQGEVKGIGPVTDRIEPTDAEIAHHLERFIRDVRSIPIDPVVLRDNWLEAYDFTTQRGAMSLNEFARANDPFATRRRVHRSRSKSRASFGHLRAHSRCAGSSTNIPTGRLL